MSEPQLVSADPNYGLTAPVAVGAHPEATISAPTGKEPVTLGDLKDDPIGSIQRIGALLKTDATNPRTWAMLIGSYFGPKVLNTLAPAMARATTTPAGAPVQPSVVATAIKAALPKLGEAALGYRLGKVGEAAGAAVSAAKAARSAPVETAAPAATPVVAPAPASAPATPPAASPMSRATPSPAPRPAAATKPHLTLDEFRAAQQLVKQGYSKDEVLKAIVQNKLPASWLKLPSDADVAASVKGRNDTGRWPEDQE